MPEISGENVQGDIPSGKVVFLIPEAYSYIKGQDILLYAILTLPKEYEKRYGVVPGIVNLFPFK